MSLSQVVETAVIHSHRFLRIQSQAEGDLRLYSFLGERFLPCEGVYKASARKVSKLKRTYKFYTLAPLNLDKHARPKDDENSLSLGIVAFLEKIGFT